MHEETYFYQFLESFTKELADVAHELESTIFSSPRMMLTHSRGFIENIILLVMREEKIQVDEWITFKERLDILNNGGFLTADVRDSLHEIRKLGNKAAHDVRQFRFSEALSTWEHIYVVVKWFVEVYGPVDIVVPEYTDPMPDKSDTYDTSEIELRLKSLEELLKSTIQAGNQTKAPAAVKTPRVTSLPGYTAIRTISYKDDSVDIPYFLRDAFLLPQRFDKSETFLIRLGAEQQARIMSELPSNLEGLHKHVKRYNEKNDANFFSELKVFIAEESTRRELVIQRPGELFLFYKDRHIVVTEELANIPFNADEFTGSPSLLRQLKEDQIETVGQLPSELAILAKYDNVGIKTIESLFEQLERKQLDGVGV